VVETTLLVCSSVHKIEIWCLWEEHEHDRYNSETVVICAPHENTWRCTCI